MAKKRALLPHNKPLNDNILFSKGNSKIERYARTMIINMQSACDCTSAKKGLCQLKDSNECYALKAEIQYNDSLPYRRKQEYIWKTVSASNFVKQIKAIQSRARYKYKFLRFSESGDFSTKKDIYKMQSIADNLPFKAYTYTARKDLFKTYDSSASKLVINGSGFMLDNMFKVVDKGYKLKSKEVLCKGACFKCSYCKVKGNRVIVVIKH